MDNISGNIVPLVHLDGNLNSSGDEQTVYRGYSAYEIALQQGFEGSKDEWLRALVGPQGETGVSVSDVRLNEDFTLTVTLDDGTEFTTESIKGDKGDKGQKGDKGDKGDTGATGAQGIQGAKGDTGADGYSPTVTITPVIGGHRITITDADGEHSADVMDGTGSVDDVQINGQSIVSDGVANVPVASASALGVVKVNSSYGTNVTASTLRLYGASTTDIKEESSGYRPIVPKYQHVATFYGLAKSAGDTTQSASSNAVGNYTEEAKSAISEMLNGSVAVSGTTPTIVAKSGIRYVCGEVATLDFTPSATGICDVVFTSGNTATVLTIPNTIKWANGFDPTSLDANTTYELNIMDGLGVAVGWT